MKAAHRIAVLALLAAALLAVAGCGRAAPDPGQVAGDTAAQAAKPVVGYWAIGGVKGTPGSLSEIALDANGMFRHSGTNMLGKPVTFGGRYAVSASHNGDAIQLVYDDFPDKPKIWFYRLDGNDLRLAETPDGLDGPTALVLSRVEQQ